MVSIEEPVPSSLISTNPSPGAVKTSLLKNIADINESQENLLFKVFEPRTSRSPETPPELLAAMMSGLDRKITWGQYGPTEPADIIKSKTNDGDSGSDSSKGSSKLDFFHNRQSFSPNDFNFDLTGYRGPTDEPRTRVNPTDLLGVFSGDPNLPKRLHISNIPFRYR